MPKKYLWAAVLVLWIAALFRIVALSDTSLLHDEMLTYQRAEGSLQSRLEHIAGPGNQVPLFFLFTGLLPHDTELELRQGAVWFSLLSLALIIYTARRYTSFNLTTIMGLALLLAVTPFLVRYGRYARPYPMFLFFSLLANILFFRLLFRQKGWATFTLTSAGAYFTHLGGGALPISQFIILIWHRASRRTFIYWFIAQAIASLPVFIWLMTYANFGETEMEWIGRPNIGRPYYTVMNLMIYYSLPLKWYLALALPPLTIGLGAGLWAAYQDFRAGTWAKATLSEALRDKVASAPCQERRVIDVYWLVLITVPMLLVLLLSQVKPVYDERYFTAILPGLFLLTLRGWEKLRILKPALIYTLVITGAITISHLVTTHYEVNEWQDSSAYVEANLQPGDGILLDAPHWLAFPFYYPDAENVLTTDDAKKLYAGTYGDLPYERVWYFMGEPPREGAREWLAQQTILEETSYLKLKVYLIQPEN